MTVMRINSNRSQPALPSAVDGTATTTPASPPSDTPDRSVAQTSGYAPSAELVQLVGLAQQQPEVRPDVVRAVAARIAQDHYLTADSAAQTAQAILHAVD